MWAWLLSGHVTINICYRNYHLYKESSLLKVLLTGKVIPKLDYS